jgi:phosphate transport system substrate-binding protein
MLAVCLCASVLVLSACAPGRDTPTPQATLPTLPAEPTLVRIATCWEALPLMRNQVADYTQQHNDAVFDIVAMNSELARRDYEAGKVDLAVVTEALALSGKPLSPADMPPQALALDAIVVIVPVGNPLTDLPSAEARALFAGQRLDWAELNAGAGQPELVVREPGVIGRLAFERQIMGALRITSAALLLPHDQAVAEYVATHPAAVGLTSLGQLGDQVRALSLDGAAPSAEALLQGQYPLGVAYIMLPPEAELVAASAFAAYAMGDEGRAITAQSYVLSPR